MARGTVVNEGVVSQAQTAEWDANAEAAGIGAPAPAEQRGSWVWDQSANDGKGKLVRPWEKGLTEEQRALDAPFIVGREYEGVPSPIDGTVFQSRGQYQRYLREKGLTNASDFDKPGGFWEREEKRREAPFSTPEQKRARQDAIGRRLYEVEKMPESKYRRVVEEATRRRRERTDLAEKAKK
jgi:hypothetical protein